jgi:hypothetical protein
VLSTLVAVLARERRNGRSLLPCAVLFWVQLLQRPPPQCRWAWHANQLPVFRPLACMRRERAEAGKAVNLAKEQAIMLSVNSGDDVVAMHTTKLAHSIDAVLAWAMQPASMSQSDLALAVLQRMKVRGPPYLHLCTKCVRGLGAFAQSLIAPRLLLHRFQVAPKVHRLLPLRQWMCVDPQARCAACKHS